MTYLGKAPEPPEQSTWPGNGLEVILGIWPGRRTLAGGIGVQTENAPRGAIVADNPGIPHKKIVAETSGGQGRGWPAHWALCMKTTGKSQAACGARTGLFLFKCVRIIM
jgi:hypothetical protein